MTEDRKKELEKALKEYINDEGNFTPYYPGINILMSNLYKEQLQEVLALLTKEDRAQAESFDIYLKTIIFNMHTKITKYKKSPYFDDENIKEIENQGYTIPFYHDKEKNLYILLGLIKSESDH